MARQSKLLTAAAVTAMVVAAGGCSSTPETGPAPSVNPGLVLSGVMPRAEGPTVDEIVDGWRPYGRSTGYGLLGSGYAWDGAGGGSGGWEQGRKDESMGIGGSAGPAFWNWVEIRNYDRRRTSNGRVRETSRTTTRTIQRGPVWSD